jgi:uncharacterized membrane protein YoaK (UPF0700 family)
MTIPFLFTGALAGSLFLKHAKKSIPPLWYTFLLALVLFLVSSSCSVSILNFKSYS